MTDLKRCDSCGKTEEVPVMGWLRVVEPDDQIDVRMVGEEPVEFEVCSWTCLAALARANPHG